MKTQTRHWNLMALIAFGVCVISAAIGIEASVRQDYAEQSARVHPQTIDVAINTLGPIGLTRGQTLRIGLLVGKGTPGGGEINGTVTLAVFDCHGGTLATTSLNPNANQCSFFDVNADQLPQQEFDNAGRAEIGATLKVGPGTLKPGSSFATAQVFDNATGKTTAVLGKGTPGGGD